MSDARTAGEPVLRSLEIFAEQHDVSTPATTPPISATPAPRTPRTLSPSLLNEQLTVPAAKPPDTLPSVHPPPVHKELSVRMVDAATECVP